MRVNPDSSNTANVCMDHNGASLNWAGKWYDDWRVIPKSADPKNFDRDLRDYLRAWQMFQDLHTLSLQGLAFVVDPENNATDKPMPVKKYIAEVKLFMRGCYAALDEEARAYAKSVQLSS